MFVHGKADFYISETKVLYLTAFITEMKMRGCRQLGAVRQQAITWANVDPYLCRHMASLGHNELINITFNTAPKTWYLITFSNASYLAWYKTYTHYIDVIMTTMASQITSLTIVYSTVYSGADQSKHQSSASLAFVWGIHRGPVNSPHKWPVTRKMFPFDDVIMKANLYPVHPCIYH